MSLYYPIRRGEAGQCRRRRRGWPKLTAVVHVRSHLIVAAVTGLGPTPDSREFAPALRQAAEALAPRALDTVLADAGYDAEHNHRLCRETLGIRAAVINLNPRNAGRRWPTTPYRRAMRRRFPRALYHQRWHAESAFSQHKRRLGAALTARRPASRQRETLLRVLAHNLMILRRRARRISTEQCPFGCPFGLSSGTCRAHRDALRGCAPRRSRSTNSCSARPAPRM